MANDTTPKHDIVTVKIIRIRKRRKSAVMDLWLSLKDRAQCSCNCCKDESFVLSSAIASVNRLSHWPPSLRSAVARLMHVSLPATGIRSTPSRILGIADPPVFFPIRGVNLRPNIAPVLSPLRNIFSALISSLTSLNGKVTSGPDTRMRRLTRCPVNQAKVLFSLHCSPKPDKSRDAAMQSRPRV
jgi:hypothetical protein